MSLQQQLKDDLKAAIKAGDTEKKSAIRVLLGEFGRQRDKELNDEQVISIIKKLLKSERELLAAKGEEMSAFLSILEGYLPQQAGEQEIRAWIAANINFDDFGSRMQAMKPLS